jgi:hypothetical protein
MDYSTPPHVAKRHTQRYHTNPEYNQVLAVLLEQGNEQLAPSFLAYELDLTANAAERLLDDMVKHSLLDLDFDDNGSLYYTLSADVLFEMDQHEASGPGNGFDGAIGRGSSQSTPPSSHRPNHRPPTHTPPADHDGRDGTVGHPGDRSPIGDTNRPRRRSRRSKDAGTSNASQQSDDGSANDQLIRHNPSDSLPARRRNAEPMIAALLSVLLVGTGQIYNRDVGKGVAFFVVYAVLLMTFFPVGWMVNVWAAIDAYSSARRRNAEAG